MPTVNLTSPNLDIQVNEGDTLEFSVVVNSTAITNLTGWDFVFIAKRKTGQVEIETALGEYITQTGPLALKVSIPPEEIDGIVGYGTYLFRAINPDNVKRGWFCGKLTLGNPCCNNESGEGNGITVNISDYVITLDFDAGMPPDVGGYFATLFATPYPNDTAARNAGLDTGDPYVFALNTDVGIAYTLKFVQPL